MRTSKIELPITVRVAQKLIFGIEKEYIKTGQFNYSSVRKLVQALNLKYPSLAEVRQHLDKMHAKVGPHFIIGKTEVDKDYADYEDYEDYESDETCYDYDDYIEEEPEKEAGSNYPSASSFDSEGENYTKNQSTNDSESESFEDIPSNFLSEPYSSQNNEGQPQSFTLSSDKAKDQGQGTPQGCEEDNSSSSACAAAASIYSSETGNTSEGNEQVESAQSPYQQVGKSVASMQPTDNTPWQSDHTAEKTLVRQDDNSQSHAGQENKEFSNTELDSDRMCAGASEDSLDNLYNLDDLDWTQQQSKELSSYNAQDSSNSGDDQTHDDDPTHQKKWGKKFSAEELKTSGTLSKDNNSNYGGVNSSLNGVKVNQKLLRLARYHLAKLVGYSNQEASPKLDYQKFCERLLTYRHPVVRKEESGRAIILIMADVSGSCSSFSDESVQVAKAASRLGVAGADILVLSHSNGYPHELEHNGKPVEVDTDDQTQSRKRRAKFNGSNTEWYKNLLNQYNIEVVIALGDWDASDEYLYITEQPQIQKFIWLDNAYCTSRGNVKNQTAKALQRLALYNNVSKSIKYKLVYKDGCKNAVDFIKHI